MTSKQVRLTSRDLINTPLYKMAVGFDNLFDDMFNNPAYSSSGGYPPYNVAKITDADNNERYEITLAVAGFTDEDIEILVENGQLKVVGNSNALAEDVNTEVDYIYKGIAERNFSRTFKMAEHVEVADATLRDGILRIKLVRNVPEALQPKRIEIKS